MVKVFAVKFPSSANEPEVLTPHERQILHHLVRSLSLFGIADSLVSVTEIERIRSAICKKLGVYRHAAVRKYAVEVGLLGGNGDRRVR